MAHYLIFIYTYIYICIFTPIHSRLVSSTNFNQLPSFYPFESSIFLPHQFMLIVYEEFRTNFGSTSIKPSKSYLTSSQAVDLPRSIQNGSHCPTACLWCFLNLTFHHPQVCDHCSGHHPFLKDMRIIYTYIHWNLDMFCETQTRSSQTFPKKQVFTKTTQPGFSQFLQPPVKMFKKDLQLRVQKGCQAYGFMV